MAETVISITARELVRKSMMLIGVIGKNENVTDEEANSALFNLNTIIDKWNVNKYLTYYTETANIDVLVNKSAYTIGNETVIDLQMYTPPAKLDNVFLKELGQDIVYKLRKIDKETFTGLSFKDKLGSIPTVFYYDYQFPISTLNIYPMPTKNYQLVLNFDGMFKLFSNLDNVVYLPPIYIKCLINQLALELTVEYQIPPPSFLIEMLKSDKSVLTSLNGSRKLNTLKMDSTGMSLSSSRGRRIGYMYDIVGA